MIVYRFWRLKLKRVYIFHKHRAFTDINAAAQRNAAESSPQMNEQVLETLLTSSWWHSSPKPCCYSPDCWTFFRGFTSSWKLSALPFSKCFWRIPAAVQMCSSCPADKMSVWRQIFTHVDLKYQRMTQKFMLSPEFDPSWTQAATQMSFTECWSYYSIVILI